MNRLERIKDMQSRAKTSHLYDGHYNDDLGYLLSIIEELSQDLSIIANSENVSSMNSIAEEALKSIKGEG